MVCTAGRLIRVHGGAGVSAGCGSAARSGPAQAAPVGKSQGSRSRVSPASCGAWSYGEIPAACTLPSQA
ncbi:hypothetical protein GCM10020254_10010 [Streptomyces goshikiensis]